jgi:hypothetical protein
MFMIYLLLIVRFCVTNKKLIFCPQIGMSSACTNPIFYGYWNESFRNEFSEIKNLLQRVLCCDNIRYLNIMRLQGTLKWGSVGRQMNDILEKKH